MSRPRYRHPDPGEARFVICLFWAFLEMVNPFKGKPRGDINFFRGPPTLRTMFWWLLQRGTDALHLGGKKMAPNVGK